jgi:hypothetical protein
LKHLSAALSSRVQAQFAHSTFEGEMATSKKGSSKRKTSSGSGPKSKRIVKNKMQKTMHEFKHHELSRGRGGKVKNPKQAIAIGLSEARRAGADIPPNPNQRKSASKKKSAGTKKTASKRASSSSSQQRSNKSTSKKSTSKKSTGRKSAPRKKAASKKR